jgi:hypothetical protein
LRRIILVIWLSPSYSPSSRRLHSWTAVFTIEPQCRAVHPTRYRIAVKPNFAFLLINTSINPGCGEDVSTVKTYQDCSAVTCTGCLRARAGESVQETELVCPVCGGLLA